MKKETVYQIKIELKGIRPPIWRRLQLPADCSMDAAADALLTAMGWSGYHLYAFRTKARHVEIPDPDAIDMPGTGFFASGGRPTPEDAAKAKLADFAKPGDKFVFDYDFGDGWAHAVTIEESMLTDPFTARKALCLTGKRACPPEDCGGPHGYMKLLETLANPDPEIEHNKERVQWIGGDWDAEAFDAGEVNEVLASWKPDTHTGMYKSCWDIE